MLNATQIYNLFSNYGNILKIKLIRGKQIALVEYESQEQADTARAYLDKC